MRAAHVRINVYGIVQGVGFRPFVKREADRLGIKGTVQNKGSYVEIMAHGTMDKIRELYAVINSCPPDRAVIVRAEIEEVVGGFYEGSYDSFRDDALGLHNFEIIDSGFTAGEKYIAPDIGICDKCAAELFDKGNRRYLHPFINCTQCGPRFTILRKLPYDRERTSMSGFEMCESCAAEYRDSVSRRFDAQPVCCNECGPQVYIIGNEDLKGTAAVSEVRRVIMAGGIAAVKGIGGFHLCCDARDTAAVMKLRDRKNRPAKPFAVMLKGMDTVRRECECGDREEALLKGYQRPIVLLRKKEGGKTVEAVSPDNPKLGVMLPYTPLHLMLFDMDDGIEFTDSLVMTSGNISGAPICIDDKEAVSQLSGFADIMLSHDREILTRADDTVLDIFEGKPYMVRRSRGFSPLPLMLSDEMLRCSRDAKGKRTVLAVGGELKNSFCIATGNMLYPSAFVGDMADARSIAALKGGIGRMNELLELSPDFIAADLHPGYNSLRVAEELSENYGKPLIKVQHHYAHILSVMAENNFGGTVIGAVFDGTGYGTGGSIWGGEIIKADLDGFTRLSHIKPFKHVGGDAAVKEGWRNAVSMLHGLFPGKAASYAERLGLCTEAEADIICRQAELGVDIVMSTSAGRLFDAVSAVLGFRRTSSFEGEAAAVLQFAAERYVEEKDAADVYKEAERIFSDDMAVDEATGCYVMSTDVLLKYIIERVLEGVNRERLALLFHHALSYLAVREITKLSKESGAEATALSGGCFQNLLLLGLMKEGLEKQGLKVLIHSLLPPNDGGIAAGQAIKLLM